jgi:hypothetical protein
MSTISALVDPYSLRARLQPALLTLLPACATLFVIAPGQFEPIRLLVVIAGTLGGAMLLTNLARDAGKKLEPRLWLAWGGKPSVAMLRHRDPTLVPALKARYHSKLAKAIKRPLPTPTEEATDPAAADELYEAANAWLLARSREQDKFQSLFADNITYGFRRNLLGLRLWVFACCVIALFAIALAYFTPILFPAGLTTTTAILATGIVLTYALLFAAVVNRAWVRRAAVAYAMRLLETVDRA